MEKELNQQPPLVYGSPYTGNTYQPQIPSYTSPYDLSGQYQTGSPMEMKAPPFPSTSYQQSTYDSPPPQQPEGETSTRFPSSRTFRDLPFFLLFILNLIGFFAIATTIGPPPPIHHYPSYPGNETYPPSPPDNYSTQQTMDRQDDYNHGNDKNDDEGEVLYGCFIAILTAILFSRVWLWALRKHPKGVTIISIVFSVLMVWVFGLVLLAGGATLWGCIWVVIGLFEIAWCYFFRSRIAFAANVLECVGKVCTLFRGMQWLSFFMLIPITLWCLVWIHTFRRIALHFNRSEECTIPALLALYCLFSFYWVTQVLMNLLHVSCCGVYATWYFMADQLPEKVTMNSMRRAFTTSLGSICLGSLLVSLVKTIRSFFSILRSSDGGCLACFFEWIMATIDYTFQYFNRYAYVQVAVYGKTFCQSAKATWNMFLLHGIDAIVNDDFTGSVLFLGTLLSGVVTALVTGSACSLVGIGVENSENYTVWVVILLAFVIGLVVGSATMEVLDSGVATVFVCFVEQPERLRLVDPEFHDKLRETYPILQTSFLPSQV